MFPIVSVAEQLERSPLVRKVPGSKHSTAWDLPIALSVQSAVNGCLTLFRAGEGKGGAEEE